MPDLDDLPEILDLAAPYALHAVDDEERLAIESARAAAVPAIRAEFDSMVRSYRETMAAQSESTATAPPAHVLDAVLVATKAEHSSASTSDNSASTDVPPPISLADARRRRRNNWVAGISAAAAVVAIAVAGVTVAQQPGVADDPISAQVLAASDVRTVAAPIDGGGTATVVFSKDVNAAVLVMNDVAPPPPGSVYQMWLTGPDHAPVSKGIMDQEAVSPSTQAVLTGIDSSTALGFSLEPSGGSAQPTEVFASIELA